MTTLQISDYMKKFNQNYDFVLGKYFHNKLIQLLVSYPEKFKLWDTKDVTIKRVGLVVVFIIFSQSEKKKERGTEKGVS